MCQLLFPPSFTREHYTKVLELVQLLQCIAAYFQHTLHWILVPIFIRRGRTLIKYKRRTLFRGCKKHQIVLKGKRLILQLPTELYPRRSGCDGLLLLTKLQPVKIRHFLTKLKGELMKFYNTLKNEPQDKSGNSMRVTATPWRGTYLKKWYICNWYMLLTILRHPMYCAVIIFTYYKSYSITFHSCLSDRESSIE